MNSKRDASVVIKGKKIISISKTVKSECDCNCTILKYPQKTLNYFPTN